MPGQPFAPVLKASDVKGPPEQHRKQESLSHGKLLKGFITGLIWKVAPAVASQAVCFRLH